jgi:hypothetical protein
MWAGLKAGKFTVHPNVDGVSAADVFNANADGSIGCTANAAIGTSLSVGTAATIGTTLNVGGTATVQGSITGAANLQINGSGKINGELVWGNAAGSQSVLTIAGTAASKGFVSRYDPANNTMEQRRVPIGVVIPFCVMRMI